VPAARHRHRPVAHKATMVPVVPVPGREPHHGATAGPHVGPGGSAPSWDGSGSAGRVPFGGEIRSATLGRKGGAVVRVLPRGRRDADAAEARHGRHRRRCDRGVTVPAVTSDGRFHDRRFITAGETVRYRRLQRKMARQHTGSANRRKTVAAMSRITGRVADRRTDFCGYTANRITACNALVVLEDLRTGEHDRERVRVARPAGPQRPAQGRAQPRDSRGTGPPQAPPATRAAGLFSSTPPTRPRRATGAGTWTRQAARAKRPSSAPSADTRGHADTERGHTPNGTRDSRSHPCADLGTSRSAKQEPVSQPTGRNP
jgi:putative transposase